MSCKEITVNILISIFSGIISGVITGWLTGRYFEERERKSKFKYEKQEIIRNLRKIADMLEDLEKGTMESKEFKQYFELYRINPEIFKSKNIKGKEKKKAFEEYSTLMNQIYNKNGDFKKEEISEFSNLLWDVSTKLSEAKYKKR